MQICFACIYIKQYFEHTEAKRETELYSNSNSLASSDGRPKSETKIIKPTLNSSPKWLVFGRCLINIEITDIYRH